MRSFVERMRATRGSRIRSQRPHAKALRGCPNRYAASMQRVHGTARSRGRRQTQFDGTEASPGPQTPWAPNQVKWLLPSIPEDGIRHVAAGLTMLVGPFQKRKTTQPTLSPRIGTTTGTAAPPMAAAFLVLEFLAGNGRIPHAVFAAFVASLPPPCPRNSSRLRKALALRALDAALHAEDAASTALLLLGKAREVLADPYIAASFPELLPFSMPDNEVTAEAAMADLKRSLDREWASLPPSTLELAADRIAGSGALETWARADGSKRRKLRLLGEYPKPLIPLVGLLCFHRSANAGGVQGSAMERGLPNALIKL
jgi:hypothetical protein